MPRIFLFATIIAAIGAAGIGQASPQALDAPFESARETATCREAVIGNVPAGQGEPIRFIEYPGALEGAVKTKNGTWSVKLGAAIRGTLPVTVTVVPRQRDNAALVYGQHVAASQVRFEPCMQRRSTGWAGAIKLIERRPVTVTIRPSGEQPIREVLLDKGGR